MGIGEELAPWSQSLVAAGPMGLSSLGSAEYMYRLRDGSSFSGLQLLVAGTAGDRQPPWLNGLVSLALRPAQFLTRSRI